MMTNSDCKIVVDVIREVTGRTPREIVHRHDLAEAMADALGATVPGFDRPAFLLGCGMSADPGDE